MQLVMIILCIVGLAGGASVPRSNSPQNRNQVVIAVSTALDSKGRVLRDTRIVIEGSWSIRTRKQ